MLVLARKKGESIIIRNDIIVTVVEIRGDVVRIGVTAPKDVPVNREEVQAIVDEKQKTVFGELPVGQDAKDVAKETWDRR